MSKWRITVFTFTLALVTLVAGCDVVGDGSSIGGNNETSGFRITYHSNGATEGTAPVDSSTYAAGDSALILSGGNLARFVNVEGVENQRQFVGWNTQADGSGTTYHPYRSVTITGDMTLYARWAQANAATYRLTFNIFNPVLYTVNDGNWYLDGDQVTLPDEEYTGWHSGNTPMPLIFIEGRDLTQWKSGSPDADFAPGQIFTVSASNNARTFDAEFTNRMYTITFEGVTPAVVGLTEGQTIEVKFDTLMTELELAPIEGLGGLYVQFTDALPTPTLAGHRLINWERDWEEYGWEQAWNHFDNRRMPAQNLVLRPVWQPLP